MRNVCTDFDFSVFVFELRPRVGQTDRWARHVMQHIGRFRNKGDRPPRHLRVGLTLTVSPLRASAGVCLLGACHALVQSSRTVGQPDFNR